MHTHLILDAVVLIDLSNDSIKYRPHLCGTGKGKASARAQKQANIQSSTKARAKVEGGEGGMEVRTSFICCLSCTL